MKKILIFSIIATVFFTISCSEKQDSQANIPQIIMETDIGNDVDDALAMDILYKFLDKKKINLLMIGINKEGQAPVEFTDILGSWYGYPDIPIGTIKSGADCENDAVNYAKAVVDMKTDDGKPLFKRSISDYTTLLEAPTLYRKILSEAKDNSVTIASVGFSTNIVRLLETSPDKYSQLSGYELVKKKVKQLVVMAGCFNDPTIHEYNVVKDIPAAKVIFEKWPTKVVASPFELGVAIQYPAKSIENDFSWAKPAHPMVEAYKAYLPMPYDRPTWDPTAVLYAVEGGEKFTVSKAGKVKVTDEGSTIFTEDASGDRYYLMASDKQKEDILKYFVDIITTRPVNCK